MRRCSSWGIRLPWHRVLHMLSAGFELLPSIRLFSLHIHQNDSTTLFVSSLSRSESDLAAGQGGGRREGGGRDTVSRKGEEGGSRASTWRGWVGGGGVSVPDPPTSRSLIVWDDRPSSLCNRVCPPQPAQLGAERSRDWQALGRPLYKEEGGGRPGHCGAATPAALWMEDDPKVDFYGVLCCRRYRFSLQAAGSDRQNKLHYF